MREVKEHYATERQAKDRYRQIAGKSEMPFFGKLVSVTYYLENTEATLKWCVKFVVEPQRQNALG